MRIKFLLLLAVIVLPSLLSAQTSRMYIPLNQKKAYDNQTRSLDGKPGPKYWQNSSDYKISIELIPDKFTISGTETISYKNNSPRKLYQLVMRLYQNILKKESSRDDVARTEDLTDGVTINKIVINGNPVELDPKKAYSARINGTVMSTVLQTPIEPNSSNTIEVSWTYPISQTNRNRNGMYNPNTFHIGYFYPQVSVYDDVDGWDMTQYKGTVEFYNDFNNYDVNITVPEKFVVWATGELQNGKDIFSSEIWDKREKARNSDNVINIITADDLKKGNITNSDAKHTWHFIAEGVPDFAFTTGDQMIWDASMLKLPNGKDVFISSINYKDTKNCENIARYARKIIDFYSNNLPGVAYPWPDMTVFNWPGGGGMEFPMMANDGVGRDSVGNIGVTAHEISHTYMPFYMGINERKYAWMDEGWATEFTFDCQLALAPNSNPRDGDGYTLSSYGGSEYELPPIIPSTLLAGNNMGYEVASYPRPGVAYDFLRGVLGEDLFKKALQEYMNRWHGKHPIPYDFFYTFNDVAGENLEWYWVPWFFERGYADLAIKDVKKVDDGYKAIIYREGILPVPVVVKFIFDDNTSETISKSAIVWKNDVREFTAEIKTSKNVVRVELGANNIPDVNKKNNVFVFTSPTAANINLKDYEGSYDFDGQTTIIISLHEGKLTAEVSGQETVELSYLKGDEFEILGAPIKVTFKRDDNKKVVRFEFDQGNGVVSAKKLI